MTATLTVFHFDGSDGCDACVAMTGYSLEEPERPHPNCTCGITEQELPCELEYDNVWIDEYGYEEYGPVFSVTTCGFKDPSNARLEFVPWEEVIISQSLFEAAVGAGWRIPEVNTMPGMATVPPGVEATIRVVYKRYVADISADVTAICEVDGETIEQELEREEGKIRIRTGMSLSVSHIKCGERPPWRKPPPQRPDDWLKEYKRERYREEPV